MENRKAIKTCCFTGHRPKFFPWRYDMSRSDALRLLGRLKTEIVKAIEIGVDTFICGGAEGVDTYAANIVGELKDKFPHIKLIIVLPFKGHNANVKDEYYQKSLTYADKIITLENCRGSKAFNARNQYMVDNSEMLIAVFDERSVLKSGTFRTIEYAKGKNLKIVQIRWMDYE